MIVNLFHQSRKQSVDVQKYLEFELIIRSISRSIFVQCVVKLGIIGGFALISLWSMEELKGHEIG
jgi:hypothetical protein